ncbi:unnamed protein product, partial [Closterium sp. NIES-54]
AAALPARQAACSVCCPPKAEAGPLFKSTQLHPIPSTTRQVLLPYLRTKLHSLFAARQRQRQARTLWVGEDDGGDDGWGGTGEEEWRRGRDGANHAGLGQGDGYGGAMGGEERSESGSSPASMGSVGSVHGHEQLDDGLGSAGWRDETPGGEGVAAAAARVTDGRAEGGAGEEEADGQGGQVVTGGATAGNSDARNNGGRRSSAIGSSRSSARGSRRWRQVLRVLRWVQRRAVRGAAAAYPWVQAPYEGLCLLYQLLYVMDATPHYSPVLHLLSLSLRRATTQELAEASSSISTRRQREFERLPGSPAIKAVQAVLLKALYFTMDYAQTSVIAVVFAFKMAEWWYQTGEQKLSAPTVYPPPPPPPPPKASAFFLNTWPLQASHCLLTHPMPALPLLLLPMPFIPFSPIPIPSFPFLSHSHSLVSLSLTFPFPRFPFSPIPIPSFPFLSHSHPLVSLSLPPGGPCRHSRACGSLPVSALPLPSHQPHCRCHLWLHLLLPLHLCLRG